MAKKKILIVEDDTDVMKGLRIRLRANGYDTIAAGDGYTATKMAKDEEPDLVLLDLGLPAGDGFVFMERLKNLPSGCVTPVVVLSAKDPKVHEKQAKEAGAVAFLQKPADNDLLLETIHKALGEPIRVGM